MYSAKAPSRSTPMIFKFSHRCAWPVRHKKHVPSPMCPSADTRSPTERSAATVGPVSQPSAPATTSGCRRCVGSSSERYASTSRGRFLRGSSVPTARTKPRSGSCAASGVDSDGGNVAPRCATGATWARRRKSALPRRSCRSGRGGLRDSMRCCRFLPRCFARTTDRRRIPDRIVRRRRS